MFRTAADRRLRDRLQIILMAHRGRPHGQIAPDLGVSGWKGSDLYPICEELADVEGEGEMFGVWGCRSN
jgi:hypothetical protein